MKNENPAVENGEQTVTRPNRETRRHYFDRQKHENSKLRSKRNELKQKLHKN